MYQSCYLPETEIYIPTTCHEVLSHLNVKYTSVLKRQKKKTKKKKKKKKQSRKLTCVNEWMPEDDFENL